MPRSESNLGGARFIPPLKRQGFSAMSLALDQLGNRTQAIECAKSALKIQEDIEDPYREKIKRKLQEWEEASSQIQ